MSSSFRRLVHDLLCTLRLRADSGVWILPGQLFVCAYPRTSSSIAALKALDIRLLVNLHPRANPPSVLARAGIAELHVPTVDFAAPSLESLGRGVAEIEQSIAAGRRVAIHCGAGRGRAGTLAACVLVARGATPDEALARVRRLRPGAVETRAQESAIAAFARQTSRR